MFVNGKFFRPSLVFVGKGSGLRWSGAPERRLSWLGSGLTHKH
jgi:hypothetical protein